MSKKINKDLLVTLGTFLQEVLSISNAELKEFLAAEDSFVESEDVKKIGELIPIEAALILSAKKRWDKVAKMQEDFNVLIKTESFNQLEPGKQDEQHEALHVTMASLDIDASILADLAWTSAGMRLGCEKEAIGRFTLGKNGVILLHKYPLCPGCGKRHVPDELELVAVIPGAVSDFIGKKPFAQA